MTDSFIQLPAQLFVLLEGFWFFFIFFSLFYFFFFLMLNEFLFIFNFFNKRVIRHSKYHSVVEYNSILNKLAFIFFFSYA